MRHSVTAHIWTHDPLILLLAGLVCVVSAFSAAGMFARSRAHRGRASMFWMFAGATAIAWGAWATHFVAMLGFESGLPARYDPTLTLASAAIVLIGCWSGYATMRRSRSVAHMLLGGAIVAGAIAAMHYVGMAGYRAPAELRWSPALVALSVAAGIGLMWAATVAYRKMVSRARIVIPPLGVVAAIVAIHFIGMSALTLTPTDTGANAQDGMSRGLMTGVIAAVGLLASAAGVAAAFFDAVLYRRKRVEEIRLTELVEKLKLSEARAQLASRTKSEFLANMGHELRTPLNGVIGLAAVLDQTELDESQRQMIGKIRESGEALRDLINDILDVSLLEIGKVELRACPYAPGALLEECAGSYRERARAKGLDFLLELDAALDARIVGDAARIRQITGNLLANALQFTESGTVRLSAWFEPAALSSAPPQLVIEVADTGVGIDESLHPLIFQPFRQADNSSTRKHGGAGLGLAICQTLVRQMGGEIQLDSAPGEGATFRVCLPAPRADSGEACAAPVEPNEAPPARLRVLLVEDHPADQAWLGASLDRLGADVTATADAAEALDLLSVKPFDLIVLSASLGEDGAVAFTLRRRRLETQAGDARTPILAVCREDETHRGDDCVHAGADAALARPFSAGALRRAVESLSRARAARPAAAAVSGGAE